MSRVSPDAALGAAGSALTAGDGTAASPTWTEVDTHHKTSGTGAGYRPDTGATFRRAVVVSWPVAGVDRRGRRELRVAGAVLSALLCAHRPRTERLVVPLALTLMWFLLATLLLAGRRRGGVVVMSVYLVTEAGLYLLDNLSGALGRDLPATDPILLIASVLGYLNALAAIGFLAWLRRHRTQAREVTAPVGVSTL